MLQSGNEKECIDVAILAEGYTEKEMDLFYQDAQKACESLFSHEPFRSMKNKFNIVAVASPSIDSGVSVPRENQWKHTAVHSHFDTFYSDRYLTTSRVKAIHNALAGIPYEHIIILANTDVYGGGGIYNSYTLTTAHHPMFKPVVVHEFGHSFGGLADEYFYDDDVMTDTYPLDVEPWEQNISTRVNFALKWEDMLAPNTPVPTPVAQHQNYPVGVYEGGGGRYDKMVGKFTGNDVPACGFSIGFERIILLLMESGFQIPESPKKVAYLVEKNYPADKLVDVMKQAKDARENGQQVLVVRMNKNKKFQKDQLTKEGYVEFVEFFNK